MNMPVMISYSSDDRDFAQELYETFSSEGIEALLDQTFLDGGDRVLHRVEQMVEQAQVLIVVLSRASLKSRWVRREMALFSLRIAEDPELGVIPLLLEACEIPPVLQSYAIVDFTSPATYPTARAELVERLHRRLGSNQGRQSPRSPVRLSQHQGKQFESLIETAVDKGMAQLKDELGKIVYSFQKQQYLLTPQTIAEKEKRARNEIWVVTTHLRNDTENDDFRESVIANFKREIEYVYFVDNSPPVQKRRKIYERIYGEFRDYYRFIILPSGMFMPFDEVVLYEPRETNCWGYAQMKYPLAAGRGDDDLFLRLPDANAVANARTLEAIMNSAPPEDPNQRR